MSDNKLIVGQIAGVFGVRGWVKVMSFTRPRENLLRYKHWWLQRAGDWQRYEIQQARAQGKGLIAQLAEIGDRDAAQLLTGSEIAIEREALPDLPAGEYYWHELIGLQVSNTAGRRLGKVLALEETGANDVLIVGETPGTAELIPFVRDHYVLDIDLDAGRMVVDWEPQA